jgi:AraC-like DNA-binding protein
MREMMVSGMNLRLLEDIVNMMGLPVPAKTLALMGQLCLDEGKEDWVSSRVMDEFYQDMVRQTGRTDLGLNFACSLALMRFGLLPMLTMHAPDLATAMTNIQKYAGLVQDESELVLDFSGEQAVMRVHPHHVSETGKVIRTDFVLAGLMNGLRLYGKGKPFQIRARFAFPEPPHADQYSIFFDGPVTFNAPFSELIFERALLNEAMPGSDPMLYSAVLARANLALSELRGRKGLLHQVSQMLAGRLHLRPRMVDIAKDMGVTDRTLRRHLADIGTDYQGLLLRLQMERACALLAEGKRTIQQVSGDIGFASASTFHRAFQRWTGTTPRAWQQNAKQRETELT